MFSLIRSSHLAVAALLSLNVAALAVEVCSSKYALLPNQANTLATNFGTLITSYSDLLANQTLDPSYTDYSESVNTLIDSGSTGPQPLLAATFSNRAQFESASATQPSVPFTVEEVWVACDTVIIRWLSNQTPQPVVGITVGHTVPAPKGNPTAYRFDKVWAEFDSGAWLVNLGIFTPAKKEKRAAMAFEA